MSGRYEKVGRLLYRDRVTGRFQARVVVGGAKRNKYMSEMFDTKVAAVAWQAESERRISIGESPSRPSNPRGSKASAEPVPVLFADYAENWLRKELRRTRSADYALGRRVSGALRPRTIAAYRQRLDNHLLPAFGRLPFCEITAERVENWVTSLAEEGYAYATQVELLGTLGALLRRAHAEGLIEDQPTHDVRPLVPSCPKSVTRTRDAVERPLLWEEVAAVADCLKPHQAVALWTQWLLGLRSGELLGLRVGSVSFREDLDDLEVGSCGGEVAVVSQRTRTAALDIDENNNVSATDTVDDVLWTKYSSRPVAMPTILARLLCQHIREMYGPDPDPGRRLFVNSAGSPDNPGSWGAVFARALRRAGFDFRPDEPGGLDWTITPHWARKNLNTWLHQYGIDGAVRSALLGHSLGGVGGARSSALITDTTYRIFRIEELRRAAGVLDKYVTDEVGELRKTAAPTWPSVAKTAALIGHDESTVRKLVAAGLLEGRMLEGRERRGSRLCIDPDTITGYLDSCRMGDDEIRLPEFAKLAGVRYETVFRWQQSGRLKCRRVRYGQLFIWVSTLGELHRIQSERGGSPRRLRVARLEPDDKLDSC